MKTTQTEPNFVESKQKFRDYTADVTTSLPKILEIGDSTTFTVAAIGSAATSDVTLGGITVSTATTGNGNKFSIRGTVTKVAASTYIVLSGTTGATVYEDTTNDYTANNVVLNVTNVQGTDKHVFIGS